MAHNSIEPTDNDRYYEGDALTIPFLVNDETGVDPIDLRGFTCEFVVKADRTDTDTDALLTKSGTESGNTDGVEFTNPENGECQVLIQTGDTDGLLTQNGERVDEDEFFVAFRVTDGNGNRVTTVEASWTIHAS